MEETIIEGVIDRHFSDFTLVTGDIFWTVSPFTTRNRKNINYLAVNVYCNHISAEPNTRVIDAVILMEMAPKNANDDEKTQRFIHCFNCRDTCYKFGKVMREYDVSKFDITVRVRINSVERIPQLPLTVFSISKDNDSEVVLNLGDSKLYASKYCLISFSSVFRGIITNSDGFEGEIELKNENDNYYTVDDVVPFLRLLYRERQQITKRNVEILLELATRYDVEFLILDCENFLISSNEVLVFDKLRFVKRFLLPKLQVELMKPLSIETMKFYFNGFRDIKTLEAINAVGSAPVITDDDWVSDDMERYRLSHFPRHPNNHVLSKKHWHSFYYNIVPKWCQMAI